MKYLLAFLLHHANRAVKDVLYEKEDRDAFYTVKDAILKKHGKHVNYDIQHIKGKRCNVCDNGIYTGYWPSGGKWHDTCNRCWGGWYILPQWICLSRMKFGPYYFHKPLKRHSCGENPFTEENMGFQVTDRQIISGYIEHSLSALGRPALLLLLKLYDAPTYLRVRGRIMRQICAEWRWKYQRIKRALSWKKLFPAPKIIVYPLNEGEYLRRSVNDDLPF